MVFDGVFNRTASYYRYHRETRAITTRSRGRGNTMGFFLFKYFFQTFQFRSFSRTNWKFDHGRVPGQSFPTRRSSAPPSFTSLTPPTRAFDILELERSTPVFFIKYFHRIDQHDRPSPSQHKGQMRGNFFFFLNAYAPQKARPIAIRAAAERRTVTTDYNNNPLYKRASVCVCERVIKVKTINNKSFTRINWPRKRVTYRTSIRDNRVVRISWQRSFLVSKIKNEKRLRTERGVRLNGNDTPRKTIGQSIPIGPFRFDRIVFKYRNVSSFPDDSTGSWTLLGDTPITDNLPAVSSLETLEVVFIDV